MSRLHSHYSGDHQLSLVLENLSSQSHLQGCYSFLASHSIKLQSDAGLVHAAFWNYLREDISVALIEWRKLMIELSGMHLPTDLVFDADHANYVTVLLGQSINQCFGTDANSLAFRRGFHLKTVSSNGRLIFQLRSRRFR